MGESRSTPVARRRVVTVAAMAMLMLAVPVAASAHHDEVVDRLSQGSTHLVSQSSSGDRGDADSGSGSCTLGDYSASDNGRFVAFASRAGNLHPADVNGHLVYDVFVHDRKTGQTDLVSALPNGLAPQPPPIPDVNLDVTQCLVASHSPALSGNGRFVAFVSNLPLEGVQEEPSEGVPLKKVFVRDLKKDTTELVSVTFDGSPAAGESGLAVVGHGVSISDDGRMVAFTSSAPNMVEEGCAQEEVLPGVAAPLGCIQIYVRDRAKDETLLASKSSSGEMGNYTSDVPSLSGNGRYVAFESEANNLAPGDRNTCPQTALYGAATAPSCRDVFLHDLEKGKTELISISRDGTSASDGSWVGRYGSGSQTVSDNGRFVVFHSKAPDIVPTAHHLYPASWSGGYVRDRKTGRTERVSVTSTGTMLQAGMFHSISDDGRYVYVNAHLMDDVYLGAGPNGGPYTPRDEGHEDRGTFRLDRVTGQLDWVLFDVQEGSVEDPPPGTKMPIADIGGNGRFLVGASRQVDGPEEDANNAYLRELREPNLGVIAGARTSGSERVVLDGHSGLARTAGVALSDSPTDGEGIEGAEILGARIVHRPQMKDLFVRIDVDRLATLPSYLPTGGSGLVYETGFEVGGRAYEVRASGGGPSLTSAGRFGLFDCTIEPCREIADLAGGYGTVGEAVVVSIPLALVGLQDGGSMSAFEVVAGLGLDLPGTQLVLDRLDGSGTDGH